MASLGSFGAAVKEVQDEDTDPTTFEFCGEEFTVEGRIPSMLMLQLGAAGSGKIAETEGMVAVWEAMRCSLNDERFSAFYKLAVEYDVELETLMELTFKLFGAQTGRPTKRRPDSSDGPSPTSIAPKPSSTHPALSHLTPVESVLAG